MSITSELREWWLHRFPVMDKKLHDDFTAIADRIDEWNKADVRCEYKRGHTAGFREAADELRERIEREYVKLPVDADGEPIHVGDYVETLIEAFKGQRGRVEYLALTEDGWEVDGEAPSTVRHYHAPTVEDVLREFAQAMNENMGMYTGEAIDADEWRDADDKTVAEYAAKLRLAGDE